MYRVIVVDDEPFITEGLTKLLDWEEMGLKITAQCRDGEQALQILQTAQVDIVISDIKMPNKTGLELIAEARELGFGQVKFILLSGYDDFEYVKQGILLGIENYLLKPVSEEELVNTLAATVKKLDAESENRQIISKKQNILRENVLLSLLRQDLQPGEVEEKCALSGIQTRGLQYCVCLLWGAEAALPEQQYYMLSQPEYTIYIVYGSALCSERVKAAFKTVIGGNANAFAAIGGVVHQIVNLHESYYQAKKMEGTIYFRQMENVVCFERSQSEGRVTVEIDYRAINSGLLNKDKEMVDKAIDQAFLALLDKHVYHVDTIHNFVIDILCHIIAAVKEIQPKKENYLLTDNLKTLFDDLQNRTEIDDIQWWIKQVANECIDFILIDDVSYSTLTQQTLDYIKTNYNENINLKTVSADFQVNPAYLGQVFKKDTGENFTDHLQKIRVLHAKELLIAKNGYTIQDIAQMIGYNNTNYFYTVFKNVTGLSPSEYKTMYAQSL